MDKKNKRVAIIKRNMKNVKGKKYFFFRRIVEKRKKFKVNSKHIQNEKDDKKKFCEEI